MDDTHYVKVKEKRKRRWVFLAGGGTNHLRVHASRFSSREKAQALIDANANDNPEWDFKVTKAECTK